MLTRLLVALQAATSSATASRSGSSPLRALAPLGARHLLRLVADGSLFRARRVADILITGSLYVPSSVWSFSSCAARQQLTFDPYSIFYLRRASKGSGGHSSPIIERVIRVTLETNSITAIFAIVDAVLFVALPQDSWANRRSSAFSNPTRSCG